MSAVNDWTPPALPNTASYYLGPKGNNNDKQIQAQVGQRIMGLIKNYEQQVGHSVDPKKDAGEMFLVAGKSLETINDELEATPGISQQVIRQCQEIGTQMLLSLAKK